VLRARSRVPPEDLFEYRSALVGIRENGKGRLGQEIGPNELLKAAITPLLPAEKAVHSNGVKTFLHM
jgi:hypothetical protein